MLEYTERPLAIELPIAVRGYDIDFAGIVSNIVYVRWLEDMRTAILERYLPLEAQVAAGFCPVLAHTDISYRRPISLFDRPHGHMWGVSLERVRWTLGAVILVDGAIVAEARQSGAFVRLDTKRPIPMPEALRAQFAASGG